MYHSYFGLGEAPFSLAPDPRYLYMSERHQEALAHLLYGVSGDGGFVLLTGEVGAGKTTVCRCLLEQVPAACDVAYLFNPKLTVEELLSSICGELRIEQPPAGASVKTYVDRINAHLLDAHAKGRSTVLIIDEAQNLSVDVLEQMRLLTNLETSRRKLLQIILVGQPELGELLERRELRQLAQRIVARYHLEPLSKPEISAYVQHRLEVAGAQRALIPASLSARLFRLSNGVPRLINVLCDRALLGAYVQGKERVDRATLAQAAREVIRQPVPWRRRLLRMFERRAAANTAGQTQIAPDSSGDATAARKDIAARTSAHARKSATNLGAKPVEAETIEWPGDQPRSRSRALAHARLLQLWGREDAAGTLRYHTARGGLDELRTLDRPVVVTLRDRRGRDFFATLASLDDDAATIALGAVEQTVPPRVLVRQWAGEYTTLWQKPPFARDNIWPGESGEAVQWLRQRLAAVNGLDVNSQHAELFDDDLVGEVKRFQRAHGLIPDGAVGLETLIRLSIAADSTAPRLARAER